MIYFKLFLSSLVSVCFSVIFYILIKKTSFSKLPYIAQQIIIGIIFGAVAIFSNEFGIDVGGAQANARDAAPLCAGLIFGGPSGIIAGVIGGVERWFSVYWGAGMYSQFACTISTMLSGVYAALLRKFMFDNKMPTAGFGFAIGIVMEVLHLSILFVTHLSDATGAYEIVKIVTFPMIFCNAFGVMLSIAVISLLSKKRKTKDYQKVKTIAQKVQTWMLVCIVLAYFVTTAFVYILQTNTSVINADNLLITSNNDIKNELEIIHDVSDVTDHRHVGETGYILIADSDKNILSNSAFASDNTALSDIGINITDSSQPFVRYEAKIDGTDNYYMYSLSNEYYIISVIPFTEVFAARDAAAYINSYMEVLVFAVLFALIYFLIKALVVNNIRSVNKNLEEIIGGNLDITVDVRTSSEFSSLSDDINSTVTTLKRYIDEAATRIDKELEFAKNIQSASLPASIPLYNNNKLFKINASMITAKEVGGDFYDYYLLGEDKLVFLIADVSGKGIPAAMFMMRAKTMLKNLAEENLPVNEIVSIANDKLCEGNDAGMFVTSWVGILNVKTGHVTFSNAGHNPPLLYNKTDGYKYLKSPPGLVLAGMEGIKYKLMEFDMSPGDRLFLYTDGVTEATDINNQLYGEERLLEFLNNNHRSDSVTLLSGLKSDIDTFVGEAVQFDDITMVSLDYIGNRDDKMIEKVFEADDSALADATAFVEEELEKADCNMKIMMQITVALEEIFVNVAHYGYPGGKGNVAIAMAVDDGVATIRFTDSGKPFDPLKKDDPDISLSAEERNIGGLGIFMVKKTMDSVSYKYEDGHNILTITKKII